MPGRLTRHGRACPGACVSLCVMRGLDPRIHSSLRSRGSKAWTRGSSPRVTRRYVAALPDKTWMPATSAGMTLSIWRRCTSRMRRAPSTHFLVELPQFFSDAQTLRVEAEAVDRGRASPAPRSDAARRRSTGSRISPGRCATTDCDHAGARRDQVLDRRIPRSVKSITARAASVPKPWPQCSTPSQ